MRDKEYDKVCYVTQQHEEHVPVRNIRTGAIGYTYLCTEAGETIQVRMENGDLDSWEKADCVPLEEDNPAFSRPMAWVGWDKNDVRR